VLCSLVSLFSFVFVFVFAFAILLRSFSAFRLLAVLG